MAQAKKEQQAKKDGTAKKAADLEDQKKEKADAEEPQLPAPADESQRATAAPSELPEPQTAHTNGTTYTYSVSKAMEVVPMELWTTSPVAGRDMISL